MKTVKLNQVQLRSLISEAIQGRQPGSPLWEEPLDEGAVRRPSMDPDVREAMGTLVGLVLDALDTSGTMTTPEMKQIGEEMFQNLALLVDEHSYPH